MIKRILESLAERRTQLKDEDKGFTLIELLVVVIIIGILVAIAIPVYIGLQNGAKDAAAKSDLTNAKIAVIAYYTENPTGAAPTTVASLANYGAVQSDGVTLDLTGITSSTSFCIDADSASDSDAVADDFKITNSAGVTTGACP